MARQFENCLLRTAITSPQRDSASTGDAHHGYDIRPRITYVDRVIIRTYVRLASSIPHPNNTAKSSHAFPVPAPGYGKPPPALEQKLSELPDGYERIVAEDSLLLIESETREIVDALPRAFPKTR